MNRSAFWVERNTSSGEKIVTHTPIRGEYEEYADEDRKSPKERNKTTNKIKIRFLRILFKGYVIVRA